MHNATNNTICSSSLRLPLGLVWLNLLRDGVPTLTKRSVFSRALSSEWNGCYLSRELESMNFSLLHFMALSAKHPNGQTSTSVAIPGVTIGILSMLWTSCYSNMACWLKSPHSLLFGTYTRLSCNDRMRNFRNCKPHKYTHDVPRNHITSETCSERCYSSSTFSVTSHSLFVVQTTTMAVMTYP